MVQNIQKRIITSIFLMIILIIGIIINKVLWLILLTISSLICFFEFKKISIKIWKKDKKIFYLINILSFVYLLFFIYASYNIYLSSTFI